MNRISAAALLLALALAGAAAAQQGSPTTPLPPPVLAPPPAPPPAPAAPSVAPATVAPAAEPALGQAKGAADAPLGELGGIGSTSSSSGPVEIEASEGIEWLRDKSVYIARGSARVARGDLSVAADTLTATYRTDAGGKTTVYRVEADGHVVILSKDSRIVGDKAVYDLDKGVAVITGQGLKATSKDNYVTARDSLEYWMNQGAVVAKGDAVAADKEREVRADRLYGYFRDDKGAKKLYQVEATGNVRIVSACNVARAAKAIYNLDNDVASLDGGVKITRGKNQLNGEHAVYNVKSGQAKVTGGGSQVKTLLVPGEGGTGSSGAGGSGTSGSGAGGKTELALGGGC